MPKTFRRCLVYAVTVITGVLAISHRPGAAVPETPVSVQFAVIGDSGTGETPQYDVAAVMAATRSRLPFEFVLMLGDNLYGGWSWQAAVERFERPYHPLYSSGKRHGSEKDLRRVHEDGEGLRRQVTTSFGER